MQLRGNKSSVVDVESAPKNLGKKMLAPKKVDLNTVNSHLVCVLCSGYFVEATSITECLHTFCRSCIVKYLQQNQLCPICDAQLHHTKPWLNLRADKIVQDLVYKLVPGLYQNEMTRRREFYSRMRGQPDVEDGEERGALPHGARFYAQDDSISLSLEYYTGLEEEEEEKGDDQNLESYRKFLREKPRRYLQCPAAVTVRHLKKFLRMKYGIGLDSWVDILYNDESLPEDFSLIDVAYSFTWKRTSPMRFSYRIFSKVTIKAVGPEVDAKSPVVREENKKTKQQRSLEQRRKQSEYLGNLNLNPTNAKLCKTQSPSKAKTSGETATHSRDKESQDKNKPIKSNNKQSQNPNRGILKNGNDYNSTNKNKTGWRKNKNKGGSGGSNNNNNTSVRNNNTANVKKSKRDENNGKTVKIVEDDQIYHTKEPVSSTSHITKETKANSKSSTDGSNKSVTESKSQKNSVTDTICLEDDNEDGFTSGKVLRSKYKYDEKKEQKKVEEVRGEKRRRSASYVESYAEDKKRNSFKRRKTVAGDEYSLRRESEAKTSKNFPDRHDDEESNENLKSEALRKVFVTKEKPDGNSKKDKDKDKDVDEWRKKRKKSKHHDGENKRRKSEDEPTSPSILTFASDPLKLKVKLNQNKPVIETSKEESGKLKKKEIEKREQIHEVTSRSSEKEEKESGNRKEEREKREKNETKEKVERRETREKERKDYREKVERRESRDRAAKKDDRDKGNKRETREKAERKEDKDKLEKKDTREKPDKKEDRERVDKKGSVEKADKKEGKEKVDKKEAKEKPDKKEDKDKVDKKETRDKVHKKEDKEKADKKEARDNVDKKEDREKIDKKETREKANKKEDKDKSDKNETSEKADKKEEKNKSDKNETSEKADKKEEKNKVDKAETQEKTDKKEEKNKADKAETQEKADEKEDKDKAEETETRDKVDEKEDKDKVEETETRDKVDEKEDKDKVEETETRDKVDKKEETNKVDKAETQEKVDKKEDKEKSDKKESREKIDNKEDKEKAEKKDIAEETGKKEDSGKVDNQENKEKLNESEDKGKLDEKKDAEKVDKSKDKEKVDEIENKEKTDEKKDQEKIVERKDKEKVDEKEGKEQVDKKGDNEEVEIKEKTANQEKRDKNEDKEKEGKEKEEKERLEKTKDGKKDKPEKEEKETKKPATTTTAVTTTTISPLLPTTITITPVTIATTTTMSTAAATSTTITKTSLSSPSSSTASPDKERLLHLRQVRHKNTNKTSVTEIISAPPSLTISKVDSSEPPPVKTNLNESKPSLEIVLVNPSENSKTKKKTEKKSDIQIKFVEPPDGDTPADIFEGVLDLSGKSSRTKDNPTSSNSEPNLPSPSKEMPKPAVSHVVDSTTTESESADNSRTLLEIAQTLVSRKMLKDKQFNPFEGPGESAAAAAAMRNLKTLSDTAVNILMAAQNKNFGNKSETSHRPPASASSSASSKTTPTTTSTKPGKDCDAGSGLKIPTFPITRDRPIPPVPNLQEIRPRGRGRPKPLMSNPITKPGQNQTVRQIPNPFAVLNRHSNQNQNALRSMLFPKPEEEPTPSQTSKPKQIPPLQSIRGTYPPPLMNDASRFPYEALGQKVWSFNGSNNPRGFPSPLETTNYRGMRNGDERYNPLRYSAPNTSIRRMEHMTKSIESVAAGLTARAASNPMVDAK